MYFLVVDQSRSIELPADSRTDIMRHHIIDADLEFHLLTLLYFKLIYDFISFKFNNTKISEPFQQKIRFHF